MKLFKQIDYWAQIILLVFFIAIDLLVPIDYLLVGYFVVGGWQIMSSIVHAISSDTFLSHKSRRTYNIVVVIYIALMLIAFATASVSFDFAITIGFISLFVTPAFAIWYIVICKEEIQLIKERELIHIK